MSWRRPSAEKWKFWKEEGIKHPDDVGDMYKGILLTQRLSSGTHVPNVLIHSITGEAYSQRETDEILTSLGFCLREKVVDNLRGVGFPSGWHTKICPDLFKVPLFPYHYAPVGETLAYLIAPKNILRGIVTTKEELMLFPRFSLVVQEDDDPEQKHFHTGRTMVVDYETREETYTGHMTHKESQEAEDEIIKKAKEAILAQLPEFEKIVPYWGEKITLDFKK